MKRVKLKKLKMMVQYYKFIEELLLECGKKGIKHETKSFTYTF